MTRRLHMLADNLPGDGRDGGRRTACGARDLGDVGLARYETTTAAGDVTCRACLRVIGQVEAEPRSAWGVVRTLPSQLARLVGHGTAALLAASVAGEHDTGPRWRSWRHALRKAAEVRGEGSPVRSSSDPDRFGQRVQVGGVGVPRAIHGREQVASVLIAMDRAVVSPGWTWGDVTVGTAAQRLALWLCAAGVPSAERVEGRRSTVTRYREARRVDVAAVVSEFLGAEVTGRQVGIVVRAVGDRLRVELERMGEVAKRREEVAMAQVPGTDLDGWDAISSYAGLGLRTAERMAQREHDPLPVSRAFGRVGAVAAEVDAWLARQVQPARRSA